jgi:hypothetical protein
MVLLEALSEALLEVRLVGQAVVLAWPRRPLQAQRPPAFG